MHEIQLRSTKMKEIWKQLTLLDCGSKREGLLLLLLVWGVSEKFFWSKFEHMRSYLEAQKWYFL